MAQGCLRVQAVLHRSSGQPAESGPVTYGQGRPRIDEPRHEASLDGRTLDLTPAEWNLLAAIAAAPERVFSRYELVNRIRGYEYAGYERTMRLACEEPAAQARSERPACRPRPAGASAPVAFVLVAVSSVLVLTVAALIGVGQGLQVATQVSQEKAAASAATATGDAYQKAAGWDGADLSSTTAIAEAVGGTSPDGGNIGSGQGKGAGPVGGQGS